MWTQLTDEGSGMCNTACAQCYVAQIMPIAFLSRELQIICARKSWIAFGAGKHFRYIAAHDLAAAL